MVAWFQKMKVAVTVVVYTHWLSVQYLQVNEICSFTSFFYFFYKFSPNLLNGRNDKDRAPAKQSLLRWPCPLPSDRAIPGLWQNLESNV